MNTSPHIPLPLDWDASPHDILAAWPPSLRLASLWSGPTSPTPPSSRWSFFSSPSKRLALGPAATPAHLHQLFPSPAHPHTPDPLLPPFRSGWLGYISFDLGRRLEPHAQSPSPPLFTPDLALWPLAEFHRLDWALAFDNLHARWFFAGNPDLAPDGLAPSSLPPFSVSNLRTDLPQADFLARVRRALDLIHAGDVYQVNLTHSLSASFSGSARSLFSSLTHAANPWFGAYLEADDLASRRAFLSASPELFLSFDAATRTLTTRPMKGTRADLHADALRDSPKENAELNMIVDLMRNDLGRVCEPGTVRVASPRDIESHGAPSAALLQATATITGRLRDDLSPADALLACFPGGSITGAPKIRAMQIIDELEPSRRGPYTGAHGYIDDSGSFAFGISIRTALLTGQPGPHHDLFSDATLRYGIGAGIVADSDPASEWLETLDKASVLRAATGLHPSPPLPHTPNH